MSKWKLNAVHGLNKFLWADVQTELGWVTHDGMIPIFSTQEMPESANGDYPFLVYTFSSPSIGRDWWMQSEQVTYMVYSKDEDEIRSALNYLSALFSRYDWSAGDINAYLAVNGSADNKLYDYKYTNMLSMVGPQPAMQLGGRMAGMITIRMTYTRQIDQRGFRV